MVRARAVSPVRVAVAWGAYELLRSRAFGGDPWALSGYAVVGWPTSTQIADLGGVYVVGLLVAAVNASIAAVLAPALRGRRPAWSIATVAGVWLAASVYGHRQLTAPPAVAPTMPIAIVQGGVGRGLRWRPEYQRTGLAEHIALSRDLGPVTPALVVWPEYAVSFYPEEVTRERAELLAATRRLGADVVLGAPHYEFVGDGKTIYHNSIYLLHDGRIAARYDKRRLVPFAETTGDTPYTPGTAPGVIAASPATLGVLLCVEAMYPDLARADVAAGASLLVNLSNDSWFGSSAAARHHLEMATFRAIETRRWLLRAATTGYSAVVDPQGRLVAVGGFDRADVLRAVVAPLDAVTVYQRLGDLPLIVAALVVAIAVASSARRARVEA
jgi:apolipoprotein N-acyltransferase